MLAIHNLSNMSSVQTLYQKALKYAATKHTDAGQTVPGSEQMEDSLRHIRLRPKEIWAIKLADRITNLQPPPSHWD